MSPHFANQIPGKTKKIDHFQTHFKPFSAQFFDAQIA